MPQWLNDAVNYGVRNAPLPVARALNQIPGGPTLVLGAANTLYNIAKNYGQISGDLDPLYKHLDQIFKGTADAKSVGTAQALSQSVGFKRFADGSVKGAVAPASNAEGSSAIQSQFDLRSQSGAHPNVNMVRRMGPRRFRSRKNPGIYYRRLYRSWSGAFRGRRRFGGGIRPELKACDGLSFAQNVFFLNDFSIVNSSAAGNTVCLNALQQGTAYNQRIGNTVQVRSILVRGCLQVPTGEEGMNNWSECVRIIIFRDRQSSGQQPSYIDLFQTTNINTGSVVTWPNRLENKTRFKILCDRRYVLSGATNCAEFFFEYFAKKRFNVQYGSSANPPTYAEIKTNTLWLACLGPFPLAGATIANTPYFNTFAYRVRFVDP